jgi:hypothetical protein
VQLLSKIKLNKFTFSTFANGNRLTFVNFLHYFQFALTPIIIRALSTVPAFLATRNPVTFGIVGDVLEKE